MPVPSGELPRELVQQVTAEVQALHRAQAPPAGAAAAPNDLGKKLKKAIPFLLTGLMEAGAIAADGQVSADEVKDIAGKVFAFLQGLRKSPTPE